MQTSDEAVRAAAREILLRPEYQRFRRPPSDLERWLKEVFEAFGRALAWLFDLIPVELVDAFRAFGKLLALFFSGDYAVFRAVAAALLVVVIVAALILLGRSLVVRRRGGGVHVEPEGGEARAHVLLGQASELAGAQRWLEAAHTMQLAVLELLLRRRWLSLDRSEPNRTLRRRLARAALPERQREELIVLLGRLETQWFRERAGDRELYAGWRAAYDTLDGLGPAPEPAQAQADAA